MWQVDARRPAQSASLAHGVPKPLPPGSVTEPPRAIPAPPLPGPFGGGAFPVAAVRQSATTGSKAWAFFLRTAPQSEKYGSRMAEQARLQVAGRPELQSSVGSSQHCGRQHDAV